MKYQSTLCSIAREILSPFPSLCLTERVEAFLPGQKQSALFFFPSTSQTRKKCGYWSEVEGRERFPLFFEHPRSERKTLFRRRRGALLSPLYLCEVRRSSLSFGAGFASE